MIEQAKKYIGEVSGSDKLQFNSQTHSSISFQIKSRYSDILKTMTEHLGVADEPSSREAIWFVPEGKISLSETSGGAFIYLYNSPQLFTNTKLLFKAHRGENTYEIFDVFHAIQKKYKINFWDCLIPVVTIRDGKTLKATQ